MNNRNCDDTLGRIKLKKYLKKRVQFWVNENATEALQQTLILLSQ